MTFLNKKEEVISVELTPYGRHLLSLGKLEPTYYSFFDDAIEYNVDSEVISGAKKRILEETPYCSPFYLFSSVDRNLSSAERNRGFEGTVYPVSENKHAYSLYPLGTSANTSGQMTPAWKAVFLHGSASNTSKTLSGSTNDYLTASLAFKNIPQIDSTINYKMSIQNENNQKKTRGFKKPSPNQPVSKVYSDGTYVEIKEEQNLLYLFEQNGFQHNESFTIEVFLYDEADEKKLVPLKFAKRPEFLKNDMLLDDLPNENVFSNPGIDYDLDITEDTVEYFLDLKVDKLIPTEDVCAGLELLKTKEVFLDLDYDCPDKLGMDNVMVSNDIYRSRVRPEDIEDCD